jgi:hypothetical protein
VSAAGKVRCAADGKVYSGRRVAVRLQTNRVCPVSLHRRQGDPHNASPPVAVQRVVSTQATVYGRHGQTAAGPIALLRALQARGDAALSHYRAARTVKAAPV